MNRAQVVLTRSVKGVFFDAGDTLFEPKVTIGESYSLFANKYGVNQDPEFLNTKFKTAFKRSPPLAFPNVSDQERRQSEYQWWYRIVRSVFDEVSFPTFDLFFEELYQFFENASAWRLFPETKEVLARLKEDRYHVGIISNFDSRLPSICKNLGIADYFDQIVFSSREGSAKPSSKIFERAVKQASILPSESIHVGDNIKNDVEGAKNIGMIAILIDRSENFSGYGETNRITNLLDIHRYLKKHPSTLNMRRGVSD